MMAVSKIVSIKSVIKGHHVYRLCYSVGSKLDCFLEPENEHSDCAIIVKNIQLLDIFRRVYASL